MRRCLLVGLVGLLVACGASSSSGERAPEADLTMRDLPVKMALPELHAFDQVLDHTTPTTDTFKQRYWFSKGFATTPTSPTILYICGEAECSVEEGLSVADTARGLGAAVLIVEHRYYGESMPFAKPTVEEMKFLTIQNALEDLAAIQKSVAREQGITGKWISAGGSYAGMLAAFYRLKHPELVAGAWASSAPVNVVKSFTGYDALAARTLGPTCSLLIRQAEASVTAQFADPVKKRAIIKQWWGTELGDEDLASVDPTWVTSAIASEGASGAQYGESKAYCDALAQHESDPLQGFLAYSRKPLFPDAPGLADAGASTPVTDGGVAAVASSGDNGAPLGAGGNRLATGFPRLHLHPSPDDSSSVDDSRPIYGWDYQVCREVGFYQVHNTDRTQSIFPDDENEASFEDYCKATFGITPDIAGTRATYYEPLMAGQATNIFFTNGSEDPWSTLSLTDPSAAPAGTSVYVVQGGSHCQDLTNLSRSDSLGAFEAHVQLNKLAKGWLGL